MEEPQAPSSSLRGASLGRRIKDSRFAESPTHRFGQIIGDVIEESVRQPLEQIADKHGLFLDHKHPRATRAGKNKVSWTDFKKNVHDLDYVLESGGSDQVLGRPKAFIEIAYRRYTKHSRNKAQEIQGAIAPIAETYRDDHPFLGVVLAGVFTAGSIQQLRSHGFGVLYFPFKSIVAAFAKVGIDAHFDEDSTDRSVAAKVKAYQELSAAQRRKIIGALRRLHRADFETFFDELEVCLTRSVKCAKSL